MAAFWLGHGLHHVFDFARLCCIFALFILKRSQHFELFICAKVGDNPEINRDLANFDQLRAGLVPCSNAAPEVPGDEARVVLKRPAVHIDQVQKHPINALQLARHTHRPLEEIARICLVVWQTVHARTVLREGT